MFNKLFMPQDKENEQKKKDKIEFQKKKYDFEQKFYRLMFELNLYNKSNKTYKLIIEDKTNYGFSAQVYLESGLSFQDLNKNTSTLEENLCCIWVMKTQKFKDYASIKIVLQPLDENKPFECPEEMKPNLLYLGLDFSLNPILVNVNTYCHFLMAGATRSGKTRLMYMILLCWILGCKVNEVELYLSDISKDEYVYFEWAKHVKYYANSIEKLWKMLVYLRIKFNKRKETIGKMREQGLATNIAEYNAQSKSKLSYCYILIDEFSIITPKKSDKESDKIMKEEIMDIITELEKTGAGMGIFVFICTQKPTKNEINDSIIKNQSAVRIGFRMNDSVSSEVIMEDHSAVGLDQRYAVYSLAGGSDKDFLFSPNLDTNTMKLLLKPHIDKNYKKKDLDAEIKASQDKPQSPSKIHDLSKKKHSKKNNQIYPVINTSIINMMEDDYDDN